MKKWTIAALAMAVAIPSALLTGMKVEAAAPKIYLSPSKQENNLYAVGDTVEMIQCNRIAIATEAALKRCGFEVKRAPMGQDMYLSIQESNQWQADLHLPIHTNAEGGGRPDHGTLTLVYDETAIPAARAILQSISEITLSGLQQEIEMNRTFAELNSTKALAVYTEIEYHDKADTAAWIIENVNAIAEALTKGICNYYGRPYVEPCQWIAKQDGWHALQNGQQVTGWLQNDKGWYYLGQDGVMDTGWQWIGNDWYYFDETGKMMTEWVNVNGLWYYLGGFGDLQTGWVQQIYKWYYADHTGVMQANGWFWEGDHWYYLETNGLMATGWKSVNGNWYYLHPNGQMAVGWVYDGNHWYYMNELGEMMSNTTTPDGYILDGNGVWSSSE